MYSNSNETVFLDEIVGNGVWLEALKKSQRGCTSIMDLAQVNITAFKVNVTMLQNKHFRENVEC